MYIYTLHSNLDNLPRERSIQQSQLFRSSKMCYYKGSPLRYIGYYFADSLGKKITITILIAKKGQSNVSSFDYNLQKTSSSITILKFVRMRVLRLFFSSILLIPKKIFSSTQAKIICCGRRSLFPVRTDHLHLLSQIVR